MPSTKLPKRPSLPRADRPPRAVTRDRFLVWRFPRVGARNPHPMSNPVWQWLAGRPELNAYMANAHFDGPSSMEVGPCWCNSRFGQSVTALPDGRVVAIGGEHEDHYDPDFFIYNDVLLTRPSGDIEVYGYPYEVFPPTDFHSATLVGDRIVIVGCLGHPSQRRPGVTPTFALDTSGLAISALVTTGDNPGWIFEHTAELSADGRQITVRGGERAVESGGFRENIDDWSLDVESLSWTRLTDRRWPVWRLSRADESANKLMTIGWMSWHVGGRSVFDKEQLKSMGADLGWTPDFALYAERYAPPVEHRKLADIDDEVGTTRIEVAGVVVRYVEQSREVRITVEGELPAEVMDALVEDARRKLGELERVAYVARGL